MQKTIVKYVSGLSDNATSFQKKQHKKYGGNLANVHRNIEFDIKHGVTREEVALFLDKVRNDSSFSNVRKSVGSKERLEQLQV
jgi:hypothetical protein